MSYSAAKASVHLTALACATVTFIAAAQAADSFRYVSISGSNANPCTLAKPCRSLQVGINKTPNNGELHILDAGAYGNNANITRSMTIVGNGNTVTLGGPIAISGPVVVLRNLVLDGAASTVRGIHIQATGAVHIERCTVRGFTSDGILLNDANVKLFVIDSIARDNGGVGLYVKAPNASAEVTVDRSRFENNGGDGINVTGLGVQAVVTNSVVAHNYYHGIISISAHVTVVRTMAAYHSVSGYEARSAGQIWLESSQAMGNQNGLYVAVGGTGYVSNSDFYSNGTGLYNDGAAIQTRQNNTVKNNATDVTGTLSAFGGV